MKQQQQRQQQQRRGIWRASPAATPLRCPALPTRLPALQKPITFFRQVLSLCEYPALMEHEAASQIYPPDAIKVGGWVGGCKAARDLYLCLWKAL
jgi:hypothetical protein